MRIRHKVNVRIADDVDMKNLLFGFDDTLAEVVIDTYEKQAGGKFKVEAGETETLSKGDVDAPKGVFIKCNADAQVSINGSTDLIQLRKAGTTSTDYARLFIEGEISSVAITAPLDIEAIGVYCFWGDIAAV